MYVAFVCILFVCLFVCCKKGVRGSTMAAGYNIVIILFLFIYSHPTPTSYLTLHSEEADFP